MSAATAGPPRPWCTRWCSPSRYGRLSRCSSAGPRRLLLTVGLLGRRAVLAGSFLMLAATGLLVGGFFLGSFALQHACRTRHRRPPRCARASRREEYNRIGSLTTALVQGSLSGSAGRHQLWCPPRLPAAAAGRLASLYVVLGGCARWGWRPGAVGGSAWRARMWATRSRATQAGGLLAPAQMARRVRRRSSPGVGISVTTRPAARSSATARSLITAGPASASAAARTAAVVDTDIAAGACAQSRPRAVASAAASTSRVPERLAADGARGERGGADAAAAARPPVPGSGDHGEPKDLIRASRRREIAPQSFFDQATVRWPVLAGSLAMARLAARRGDNAVVTVVAVKG